MLDLSPRSRLAIGIVLAALLAMTRGHHFGDLNLPSASWAVFFLAGVLLPAYAALWFGGRVYAGWHRDDLAAPPRLLACLLASSFACHLLSSGGFWFFSGRYPEATLAGFLPRIATYYPQSLQALALYVGAAVLLLAAAHAWKQARGVEASR